MGPSDTRMSSEVTVRATKRYRAICAQLRAVIDERSDHWSVQVSDVDHIGPLFQTRAASLDEAMSKATAFVRRHLLPEVEGQEEELPEVWNGRWTCPRGDVRFRRPAGGRGGPPLQNCVRDPD